MHEGWKGRKGRGCYRERWEKGQGGGARGRELRGSEGDERHRRQEADTGPRDPMPRLTKNIMFRNIWQLSA